MNENQRTAWGILNAFGDPWTVKTFVEPEDAQKHIDDFGSKYGLDMRKHKVVEVLIIFPVPNKPKKKSKA